MTTSDPPDRSDRKRGSGVKHVYDTLRDEIIDLELEPGSPVDEIHLAERFGMSRTPIREALVRLAGDGLVTHAAQPFNRRVADQLSGPACLFRRADPDVSRHHTTGQRNITPTRTCVRSSRIRKPLPKPSAIRMRWR